VVPMDIPAPARGPAHACMLESIYTHRHDKHFWCGNLEINFRINYGKVFRKHL
jgi:hypothetical protein